MQKPDVENDMMRISFVPFIRQLKIPNKYFKNILNVFFYKNCYFGFVEIFLFILLELIKKL